MQRQRASQLHTLVDGPEWHVSCKKFSVFGAYLFNLLLYTFATAYDTRMTTQFADADVF